MNALEFPVLDPADIPRLALESMNATHREEVELINRLGRLLLQGRQGDPDSAAIGRRLDEWLEHTREHFERENSLMRKYGFPAYPVHSGEHQTVLTQIEELRNQWVEKEEIQHLAAFILEEWPRWFDMHVNSMDAVTAQFVSQRGG